MKKGEAQQPIISPHKLMSPSVAAFYGKTQEVNEKVKSPDVDREEMLIGFADSDIWQMIKEVILDLQEGYSITPGGLQESGFHLEEIGLKFLTSTMVNEALQTVIDVIELPRDAKTADDRSIIESKKQDEEDESVSEVEQ